MHNNSAYKAAVYYIKTNPEIIKKCGNYLNQSPFVFGSYTQKKENNIISGNSEFKINFSAENGDFLIKISLKIINNIWEVTDYELSYR